ncbi:ribonuclease HI family protein [Patescibacteria group bacterium]
MISKKDCVFADGGSRGNPGPAAVGFLVKDGSGQVVVRQGKYIGQATNNVAEYSAVIEALKWIKKNKQLLKFSVSQGPITFYLDSLLVVNQLNGLYKIKNADLRNLIIKVRALEEEIGKGFFYQHIPRLRNKEADALVNQSLNKALSRHVS